MTRRPRCGNDPRARLTPGDRAAIDNLRAFLEARAEEKKTVNDLENARAALRPFEIITGFVDDLRRFEAAVRANERAGATRAAVLREAANIADEVVPPDLPRDDRDQGRADAAADIRKWADHVEREGLRRMADEAQPGAICKCPGWCGHKTTQADEAQP